ATAPPCWHANQPLRPHHLRTGELVPATDAPDAVTARQPLLGNDDVEVSFVTAEGVSPLYRDAGGDEIVFVHEGDATLASVFGRLRVTTGDYVVVPASTTHRWRVDGTAQLMIIAARGHVRVPDKYTNADGQLLEGAPFSERDQRGPDPEPLIEDGEEVPVFVRT